MTFAENEERSIWPPFHTRHGFKKEESTISTFQGWSAINSMGAAGCCRPAQEETLIIMQAFPCLRAALTLVMDPLVANHLKEQGFDTPEQLSEYLSQNFKMSAGQFFGSDVNYSLVEPNGRAGVEPFATWLKLAARDDDRSLHAPRGHQRGRGRRRDPGSVAHHRLLVLEDHVGRQVASRERGVRPGRTRRRDVARPGRNVTRRR